MKSKKKGGRKNKAGKTKAKLISMKLKRELWPCLTRIRKK
jgi:hypothetical protein